VTGVQTCALPIFYIDNSLASLNDHLEKIVETEALSSNHSRPVSLDEDVRVFNELHQVLDVFIL